MCTLVFGLGACSRRILPSSILTAIPICPISSPSTVVVTAIISPLLINSSFDSNSSFGM